MADSEGAIANSVPLALPDVDDADIAAVVRVLRSGWLTTGVECEALEEDLASYLGAPHVTAVSSCTAALEITFAWLALPPGARVGVPTWTFVASALAPARFGLQPVLLDVDPDTLNLSPRSLERALDDGLDAVVAVHFGGTPVAREVLELCQSRAVPVVEDAAHALGATDHRGRVAGRGSVAACLSFYANKNITSAEGGAIVTEHEEFARFARTYRLHGLTGSRGYQLGEPARYDLVTNGVKANLPDVLAALARSQLARLQHFQEARRSLTLQYRARLAAIPGIRCVPKELVDGSADHLMAVALPESADRDAIAALMSAAGIGTSVHFQPLHTLQWFDRHASVGPGGCPTATAMARAVMSLPLHTRLTEHSVNLVCDALEEALST